METFGKEYPSCIAVKKWEAEFKMNGLAALKMPLLMKISMSCTPWLCVIAGETAEHSYRIGHKLWGSTINQTEILGMSKVSARWLPRMLTDDQIKIQQDIFRFLLSLYEDDPCDFIRRVVTQDEPWDHHFDPEN